MVISQGTIVAQYPLGAINSSEVLSLFKSTVPTCALESDSGHSQRHSLDQLAHLKVYMKEYPFKSFVHIQAFIIISVLQDILTALHFCQQSISALVL